MPHRRSPIVIWSPRRISSANGRTGSPPAPRFRPRRSPSRSPQRRVSGSGESGSPPSAVVPATLRIDFGWNWQDRAPDRFASPENSSRACHHGDPGNSAGSRYEHGPHRNRVILTFSYAAVNPDTVDPRVIPTVTSGHTSNGPVAILGRGSPPAPANPKPDAVPDGTDRFRAGFFHLERTRFSALCHRHRGSAARRLERSHRSSDVERGHFAAAAAAAHRQNCARAQSQSSDCQLRAATNQLDGTARCHRHGTWRPRVATRSDGSGILRVGGDGKRAAAPAAPRQPRRYTRSAGGYALRNSRQYI